MQDTDKLCAHAIVGANLSYEALSDGVLFASLFGCAVPTGGRTMRCAITEFSTCSPRRPKDHGEPNYVDDPTKVTPPKLVVRNSRQFRRTGVFVSPKLHITRTKHLGEQIFFAVENPSDFIQSEHLAGRFYEPEELSLIARYFPQGGVYCDIGANIGNHLIYACKFLHARQAIVFEPNPNAISILESNIFLNGLQDVCVRDYLGVGLGAEAKGGMRMRAPRANLGAGMMVAAEDENEGGLEVRRGDDLLQGRSIDFIKIDVEGMEMEVLAGLEETFRTNRPAALIEVRWRLDAEFHEWCVRMNYKVQHKLNPIKKYANYLISPAEESRS